MERRNNSRCMCIKICVKSFEMWAGAWIHFTVDPRRFKPNANANANNVQRMQKRNILHKVFGICLALSSHFLNC